MKGSASKIQLAGFDDLFQTGGKAEANGEQVQEVPLAEPGRDTGGPELRPRQGHQDAGGAGQRKKRFWPD